MDNYPRMIGPSSRRAIYIPAEKPILSFIARPGKTARSADIIVPGHVLGLMLVWGKVLHYRFLGADGAIYLAPPHWLPDDPLAAPEQPQERDFVPQIMELIELARLARRRRGLPMGEPA